MKKKESHTSSPSSVTHQRGELHQFSYTLQTIPLHSQIMWDNTSIMTKALFAGSPRGQPTLCRVFMLSHTPIISQWQRQKLANVHQGASLLKAAPVKLRSRWDRVRFAPRRRVKEKERRMGIKSWRNRFLLKVLSACFSHASSCIFSLTRENAGPKWLIISLLYIIATYLQVAFCYPRKHKLF